MKRKFQTVTSDSTRVFTLLPNYLHERESLDPYFAKRSEISKPFCSPSRNVWLAFRILGHEYTATAYLYKSGALRIGCQKFSPEEVAKLRKWAVGAQQ